MSAEIVGRGLGVRFIADRQRRPVTPAMARIRRGCTSMWAFRGLDLELSAGAGLAVIGENGAGKSTLLRVLAGVLPADEGQLRVRGRVASLLSVDGGLMPLLTGRENAVLIAVLAGLRLNRARRAVEPIRQRSGLDEAFERPVATYSQGMRARLGLAVMEETDPEILILDEVHEALDGPFRERLEARSSEIRRGGGIVVAAGHDLAQLGRLCPDALHMTRSGRYEPASLEEIPA